MNSGDADKTDHDKTDRLERALRVSLRPVDPGADFTATVQARLARTDPLALATQPAPPGAVRQPGRGATGLGAFHRGPHPRLYAASLAAAASLVVALGIGWQLLDVRAAQHAAQVRLEQLRVHDQVLLALEITSERLGLAQQRIEQYQSQEKNL